MNNERRQAFSIAALLLVWSTLAPRVPQRWKPLPHLLVGAGTVAATGAPLGLRPPALAGGLRWGGAAAVTVVAAVAVSTTSDRVRSGMAERTPPPSIARWLLLHIPVGTVWSEEAGYRAALGSAAARAFGDTTGRWFTALVFGLSHVPDARAARASVPGTVLVTGAAGWVFSWLRERSGSLAAPMLAHLAFNEAGAVGAVVFSRRLRG
ncbi:CPBP family intramembrane metalloprotease [Mycolicibacterium sp. 018/SC-01/001]|uniref:Rv0804 family intramembrane glutamic endopeptidase n=1 Tax=Mycolicibacterium sp. 018/SC-01/001 TaxID=2592069 RepID=UPI001180ECE4|nr:CPBP family intramembrane glutamic endopeptidase [Mycolicibacterium sp. 018/SC-01/001]TRW85518.1 CPBP family intramembrane metalloprotease [Mycolicibacterium sp. 018/SC-01/001]